MNKFNKSELLVLFVLTLLLAITPLLPSSLRPTYLYFIFNVLIIALAAEAGVLSVSSKPLEDKKQHVSVTQKPVMPPEVYEPEERVEVGASEHDEKKPKVVEKPASDEKIVGVTEVKKFPSMPNLLLIGGGESEGEVMDEEIEAEDEVGGVNGQELFAKAEAFIGNFYNQLKKDRDREFLAL
ncbi:hypothetical protein AAZX31_14G020800 [Glycine max]|uniref:DUF4408 domain-containing protein n=2 Tax=Glycine subgen. Soja TaxID=1462606 RepID=K7M4H8_SOYBN|nr:hypothetical protein JHK87_038536 [Glycine soja]KAG4961899.1 hypothetical protein JHK86_038767 [Glycine max]KAG4964365.1 hypothetical protein JHK85_039340 [Glycine max]KAG5109363.1 hypothetical protein JHK82_038586 [Glycine max]KAH1092750.1 hypothetical protein GYH30_038789 [Glycine max]|eukprot:XP_014622381.1 uncharacterized protein LOC100793277 [Glycine max]